MMDKKEVPSSCLMISSEDKPHILYPMCFGVSCAFVALKLLLGSDLNDEKWLETRDRMLQGSTQLLGLLVWRIQREEAAEPDPETLQRLEKAEMEVSELKKRRSEDAKANEKVVSIFAAQEQTWLRERKKLQKQIGALLHELRFQVARKEEIISDLNEKIKEKEVLLQSRDKSLEEEEGKRKEMEEKLKKAEASAEGLRETMKKVAEEHSSELWKHKTAFIELVSNHRQLESEMGRALRQIDAAKQEINSVLKQKEESVSMVQKLSMEVTKMRKDLEQKDKILSAMLRKSKVDTMEKEVLLKELKVSKARRKEAEIETEKWKAFHESKHEKKSTTSNLSNQGNARLEAFSGYKGEHPIDMGCSQDRRMGSQPPSNWMNCKNLFVDRFDQSYALGNGEFVVSTDVKQLEDWVHSETERNTTMLQERHHLEIDAFTEQLRLKDEKLEAFRWRLLSSELEVKRLESHMKGLNQNILQLREEKIKMKALLLEQETKVRSLQEIVILQPNSTHCHEAHWDSSPKDLTIDSVAVCSDAKTVEKDEKAETDYLPHEAETVKEDENPSSNHSEVPTTILRQVTEEDFVLEKEVPVDMGGFKEQCSNVEPKAIAESTSRSQCLMKKDTPWRVDLHAMGVSYNIRRLRQQLLLLEKLVSMPEICKERSVDDGTSNLKTNFHSLMPLLNKQISRYQSLQEKIDDLSSRMSKDNPDGSKSGHRRIERTREETRTLECLLEETFQLQRYMVATGQKLIEIQTKMASKSVAAGIEETKRSANFDTARFSDNVRTLFKEVQKGLEVRIARVIGNLEGTLAFGRSFDSVTRAHEAHSSYSSQR
ncbi:hypothetical protein Scep_025438 [Stephania cephalantha]|uniref:Uncharacterized protein n=1 Tax=Stephania cephalantha TaxID=152367 RepID=A0AAP0ES61_9MAGN